MLQPAHNTDGPEDNPTVIELNTRAEAIMGRYNIDVIDIYAAIIEQCGPVPFEDAGPKKCGLCAPHCRALTEHYTGAGYHFIAGHVAAALGVAPPPPAPAPPPTPAPAPSPGPRNETCELAHVFEDENIEGGDIRSHSCNSTLACAGTCLAPRFLRSDLALLTLLMPDLAACTWMQRRVAMRHAAMLSPWMCEKHVAG